ncbi:MAG: T9SS type A sorting domain-containing protein [Flavipsychrobacter sp.]
MKTLIQLLVTVLICITAKAQTPLADFYSTNTSWTWYATSSQAFSRNTNLVYNDFVSGDSVVKGKIYKLIKQYKKGKVFSDHGVETITRYSTTDQKLLGGIRVDSEKVYFINLDVDTNKSMSLAPLAETIIYDFDLKVGDTVKWKPYDNIVLNIDSVKLSNGKYEKRYHFFNGAYYKDFWIRGVGSSFGFLHTYDDYPYMYYWEDKYHGVCYEGSASFKFYETANLDTTIVDHCYLIFPLSVNSVSTEASFILYPNPVSGSTYMLKLVEDAVSVNVYDIKGKVVSSSVDMAKGLHQMQAPGVVGVYIVQVVGKNGSISYARFEKL